MCPFGLTIDRDDSLRKYFLSCRSVVHDAERSRSRSTPPVHNDTATARSWIGPLDQVETISSCFSSNLRLNDLRKGFSARK